MDHQGDGIGRIDPQRTQRDADEDGKKSKRSIRRWSGMTQIKKNTKLIIIRFIFKYL
jgi:hypothetical protein